MPLWPSMQKAHGMREMHLAAPDHDPLAAHAAKRGQIVFGGEATAVDHEVGVLRHADLAELYPRAGCLRRVEQKGQGLVRGEMRLARIIECACEALREVGLELR
jgi:hypothetical protein